MHDEVPAAAGPQQLAIEFTGSGSEYLRIWLVNLLLTAVTLSLYHPFAKARRLAYFHANTRVGGQALGFHGNPWKMLRGHLLILLFGGTYAVSSRYSPTTAVLAIGCFALLWPALWRASLQFRLGNTSWRGLRLGFDGSLGGAYRAMLPALVPWVALASINLFTTPPDGAAGPAAAPDPRLGLVLGLVMLLFLAVMPLALAWVKRYQHGHYVYADQRTRLELGVGRFYAYMLKVLGIVLVLSFAGGVLLTVVFASAGRKPGAGTVLTVLAFYAAFFVVLMPYSQSRLQNLVWGHTRTREIKFHSQLRLWPLMRLTFKNLVFMLLTLGLYWPFAAVATSRLRLHAVSLELPGDIAGWTAGLSANAPDATGDAAGDFFGIDLGL